MCNFVDQNKHTIQYGLLITRAGDMERSTQSTWLDEGFTILKKTGAAGLTIENLTRRLKKSKGSFYHHFKSRDDYSEKLLSFWERKQTFDIIEISRQEKTFDGINTKLLELSTKNLDPEIEVAIRAWALRDPQARAFQERIDKQRFDFLRQMFSLKTGDPDQAQTISFIRYCFYIGSQQLIPALDDRTYREILGVLMEMFEQYITPSPQEESP